MAETVQKYTANKIRDLEVLEDSAGAYVLLEKDGRAKRISVDELLKESQRSDWSENDPNSPVYIHGRTHYKIPAHEEGVLAETAFVSDAFGAASVGAVSLAAGESYKVTLDGVAHTAAAQAIGDAAAVGNLSFVNTAVLSRNNFAPLAADGTVSSIVVFFRAGERYFAIDGGGNAVEIKLLGGLGDGTIAVYDKAASIVWTATGDTAAPVNSDGAAVDYLDFVLQNPTTGKYLLPTIDGDGVKVVMDDLSSVSGRSHTPGFFQSQNPDELTYDEGIDLSVASQLTVSNSSSNKCCLTASLGEDGVPVFGYRNWGSGKENLAADIGLTESTSFYVAQVNTAYADSGEPFCLLSRGDAADIIVDGGSAEHTVSVSLRKGDEYVTIPPEYLPKIELPTGMEYQANRVTEVNDKSDDEHYPTAKAAYDAAKALGLPEGAAARQWLVTDEDAVPMWEDKPFYDTEELTPFVEETEYTITSGEYVEKVPSNRTAVGVPVVGRQYRATVDGVTYDCVGRKFSGYYYVGNAGLVENVFDNSGAEHTGETFFYGWFLNNSRSTVCVFGSADGVGTHTFSLATVDPVYHPIEGEYLGDRLLSGKRWQIDRGTPIASRKVTVSRNGMYIEYTNLNNFRSWVAGQKYLFVISSLSSSETYEIEGAPTFYNDGYDTIRYYVTSASSDTVDLTLYTGDVTIKHTEMYFRFATALPFTGDCYLNIYTERECGAPIDDSYISSAIQRVGGDVLLPASDGTKVLLELDSNKKIVQTLIPDTIARTANVYTKDEVYSKAEADSQFVAPAVVAAESVRSATSSSRTTNGGGSTAYYLSTYTVSNVKFELGKWYAITLDGIKYVCQAYDGATKAKELGGNLDYSYWHGTFIGDSIGLIEKYSATLGNEPFTIQCKANSSSYTLALPDTKATKHTVLIEQLGNISDACISDTLQRIDDLENEYNTPVVEEVVAEILPETSVSFTTDSSCTYTPTDVSAAAVLEAGKTYEVSFNGQKYICEAVAFEDGSDDATNYSAYVGNAKLMGDIDSWEAGELPFFIGSRIGDAPLLYMCSNVGYRRYSSSPYTGTAKVAINEVKVGYKQIGEKNIPDTIMRVGDDVILASSTEGSTKKFRLTVDDSGTISATEVTV